MDCNDSAARPDIRMPRLRMEHSRQVPSASHPCLAASLVVLSKIERQSSVLTTRGKFVPIYQRNKLGTNALLIHDQLLQSIRVRESTSNEDEFCC